MGGTVTEILKEARRLYNMGLGVHWIRPNSKAPVKAGWTEPKRDQWPEIESDYHSGYGLGVKLGAASKTAKGYLANIDIDLKSQDEKHQIQALQYVRKTFPEILKAPTVQTGYGLRLFVCTKEPLPSRKLTKSNDTVIVHMPTADISAQQRKLLPESELQKGMRARPAWEVEFMSAGRQVVLPPSIHPDTQKPYIWNRELNSIDDLPELDGLKLAGRELIAAKHSLVVVGDFRPVQVDLMDPRFPDHIVEMILGQGVDDRSAALFQVAMGMVRHGFSDNEILSVLTDKDTMLGETAYEHRHTSSRDAAAAWVRDYCLKKAKAETSAVVEFDSAVEISLLDDKAAESQKAELMTLTAWQTRLKRTRKEATSPIKPSLENVLLILEHTYGVGLFREDLFSNYWVYGLGVPWGKGIGEEFDEKGRLLLTEWLVQHWGCEPPKQVIYDAVGILAARSPFHPIRDYVCGLRWDGVERLDGWLERYLGARDTDTTYLKEVSRKFLVGMIKRALEPGCQFDYMLVLHGKQGIKKSSALRILAGDKYFSSTVLQPDSKDTLLKMQSKWLIEFGEMSTAKADVRALKNFITMRTDRDRLPYDRLAQDFPRKCVFAGSTNDDEIIFDMTGGRRFWVVSVHQIDLEALARDRDQLFAEAMNHYDLGEPLYLSAEGEIAAQSEQAKWTFEDGIIEQVMYELKLNNSRQATDPNFFPHTGFGIMELIKNLEVKDDMVGQKRVAIALKACGYAKRQVKLEGNRVVKKWFRL